MIKVNLKPTYSKLADEKEVKSLGLNLPDDWKLSQHQVDTYKAFLDPEIKVIFNTAMTGDGKSLSAYLPLISREHYPMAMYPTNELIYDQNRNLKKYPNITENKYKALNSKIITEELENTSFESRRDYIENILSSYNSKAILTNPDLFHLFMTHQYGSYFNWQGQQLPYYVSSNFDYFIFDEFHIFEIPQIVSITNILNYIEARQNDKKKYIFLSATPKDSFTNLLENSGLTYKIIEGYYSDEEQDGYRQILQKVALNIDYINQDQKTFDWIVNNIDLIKEEISNNKKFKGAIIVDSIALAKNIKSYLLSELKEIRILENTGLTNDFDKNKFREEDFDLLVATSTVDVGVDFKINFLIFESFSQGAFLQRLGRLGRHSGFDSYTAYSLVPRHIYDKLEVSDVLNKNEVKRDDFNLEIKNIFDSYNEFKGYVGKWGILQSAQILASLEGGRDTYKDLKDRVADRFTKTYLSGNENKSLDKYTKKLYAMNKNPNDKLIIESLNTFRGSSNFECSIYDKTDNYIKNYDLFFLIKNTDFRVLKKDEFIEKYNPSPNNIKYSKFFVELEQYKDKTDSYSLKFDGDIFDDYSEKINQISVLSGFTIQDTKNSFINDLNRIIYKENLVCLISDMKAKHLKTKYRLPLHFPIFTLKDDSNSDYCVAFGKEAFLLDSLLWWKKPNKESFWII